MSVESRIISHQSPITYSKQLGNAAQTPETNMSAASQPPVDTIVNGPQVRSTYSKDDLGNTPLRDLTPAQQKTHEQLNSWLSNPVSKEIAQQFPDLKAIMDENGLY